MLRTHTHTHTAWGQQVVLAEKEMEAWGREEKWKDPFLWLGPRVYIYSKAYVQEQPLGPMFSLVPSYPCLLPRELCWAPERPRVQCSAYSLPCPLTPSQPVLALLRKAPWGLWGMVASRATKLICLCSQPDGAEREGDVHREKEIQHGPC